MRFKIIFFLTFLFNTNIFLSQNLGRKITIGKFTEIELAILNNLEQKKAKYRAKYKIREVTYFKRKRDLNRNLLSKKQLDSRKIYNKSGKLQSSEQFYVELNKTTNKEEKIKYTTRFEYDNNGNLIRTSSYSEKGKLTGTFEIKNQPKQTTELKLDSLKITYYSSLFDKRRYLTSYKNKYQFDKSNRILKWKNTYKNNSQKSKFIYSYNNQNFTRKEIRYNSSNTIKDYIISKYNSRGFETKSYRYSKDEIIEEVKESEYKYFE